ncbi:Crp/Fnr family transcriptional regulator [Polyangium jinanense]|uniref:Cyclic nucleotide-binding domain-containing protein n=1 Tax=Polyangium jinanense TaxID=2829994 RepID=A0A9X4AYX6_9BACT|nr:cyclic nucleotide-binding domain-containing protein [Polyangium jinanense]MDC3961361.1 cyclic nucleotide-binding domain-containing protein [Polyangium jinanense]MDC3987740.1 cyclic nucleotide-binding domain-containing protein [Polyangium jinanense]
MTIRPADLHAIPLFEGITEAHLAELIEGLERVTLAPGDVLFEAGTEPKHLWLLASGEIALEQAGEVRFRLAPIAPIGELGALTGLYRNTRAVATEASELYRIGVVALMRFFESHGDVAFPFYHNLLKIVAQKVHRDAMRQGEMRANIIRTQKAMKELRDRVLEAEETPISRAVCETLDTLIEHNRRVHYMVTPAYALSTSVRLDTGVLIPVSAMSDRYLELVSLPDAKAGDEVSFVLVIPNGEIPVSGKVRQAGEGSVLIELDLLIEEYAKKLSEHLTRVQMLDFVV